MRRAKTTRRYFGGLYTSTRTLNTGVRVRLRRIQNGDPASGVILTVVRDEWGDRMAEVRWDAGVYTAYKQLVPTALLRRDR